MSNEGPKPSLDVIENPVSSVDIAGDLSPVLSTRNSQPRRLAFGGAAVLAVATAFSSFAGDRPVRAQGAGESPAPSPIVSMEPGTSFDPNGETAQGEIPCEPVVVPAAQTNPDSQAFAAVGDAGAPASIEPSPVAPSPAASVEPGGDSGVGGEPNAEVCNVSLEKMSKSLDRVLNQKPRQIDEKVTAKSLKKAFNLFWNGEEITDEKTGEVTVIPGLKDKLSKYQTGDPIRPTFYDMFDNGLSLITDPSIDIERKLLIGPNALGMLAASGVFLTEAEYDEIVVPFLDKYFDYFKDDVLDKDTRGITDIDFIVKSNSAERFQHYISENSELPTIAS